MSIYLFLFLLMVSNFIGTLIGVVGALFLMDDDKPTKVEIVNSVKGSELK